jgi:hypothetical protein
VKYWASVLLLVLLLIETLLKAKAGLLSEMLWVCYPATLMLAIGLLFDVALLSASGFLFHLCIGFPAYLLILASNEKTDCVSFLIHFLSPVIGLWAWRGKPLPFASSIFAISLVVVFIIMAYFFTAPKLNINLAFKLWEPIVFLGFWQSHIINIGLILSLLLIGRVGINRSIYLCSYRNLARHLLSFVNAVNLNPFKKQSL